MRSCTYARCALSTTRRMPSIAKSPRRRRYAKRTRQIFAITSSRRRAPMSRRTLRSWRDRSRRSTIYSRSNGLIRSPARVPPAYGKHHLESLTRHYSDMRRDICASNITYIWIGDLCPDRERSGLTPPLSARRASMPRRRLQVKQRQLTLTSPAADAAGWVPDQIQGNPHAPVRDTLRI
jgi:hypothetical protein